MLQVSAAVLLKGFIMIKLTDVKKRFGDLEVLKGISITINDGEIYGIIGQSGAGKSTLLRCINGLESYDGGTITVDNELVSIADQQKLHLMQKTSSSTATGNPSWPCGSATQICSGNISTE